MKLKFLSQNLPDLVSGFCPWLRQLYFLR